MQSLLNWAPVLSAVIGVFLMGNGGITLNDALKMETSNIWVLAQGVGFLLVGSVFGGAGWHFKGADVEANTYKKDTKAIKHLVSSCKGCKASKEALEVINTQILKRQFDEA